MTQFASSQQSGAVQNKRTLLFILLLLLLIVLAVIGVSRYVLESSRNNLIASLEQSMAAKAQNRAVQLARWFGTVADQAEQLAARDQVRLFASEAANSGLEPLELLRRAEEASDQDSNQMFAPDTDSLSEAELLKAQAPTLRRQFVDFVGQSAMSCVNLLDLQGRIYVSTHPEVELVQAHANTEPLVRAALGGGKLLAGPVYSRDGEHQSMDMAMPVSAPLYVDAQGAVVGVLLLSHDVTQKIAEYTQGIGGGESSRVIQIDAGKLYELIPGGERALPLPGWDLDADGNLPMSVRSLPARGDRAEMEVYSLAIAVQDMPWLVGYDMPVDEALAPYHNFCKTVYITAGLVSVVAALILGMLWWWMLGRRERAVSREIRALYDTVFRQKQIIDSVNTSLGDGIVLCDLTGHIPYANQAFAAMVEESADSLAGRSYAMLNAQSAIRSLPEHISLVRRNNREQTFTELLNLRGEERHYQIVCSPLRDEQGVLQGVVSVYRDITSLVLAQERAQHMVNQTVHVFVRAIEAVDPYLRGQSTQTGVLSVALAERLDLAGHAATLRTAANLCQVGMIQLPHALLTKTGTLTSEERLELQKHVEYAYNALEGIDFGLPVLDAIMQMHERLDGSGYPGQLQGDDIRMDGRILAVAATFCALMRPRSYRQAKNLDAAMAIIGETPPRYDPAVVQSLADYLQTREGQEFLRELIRQ